MWAVEVVVGGDVAVVVVSGRCVFVVVVGGVYSLRHYCWCC